MQSECVEQALAFRYVEELIQQRTSLDCLIVVVFACAGAIAQNQHSRCFRTVLKTRVDVASI